MKKYDPLGFFIAKKEKDKRLDGFTLDDIEGQADDDWFEKTKRFVPEVVWNPEARRKKAEKGGKGSGNFGHGGLAGVHGGSSPKKGGSESIGAPSMKKREFVPRTTPIDLSEHFGGNHPRYQSPTMELARQGNVPLFDINPYLDSQALDKINNRFLREHVERKMGESIAPEDFENYKKSIEWIAETAAGLEGHDPVSGLTVSGEFSFDFRESEDGGGDAEFDMEFSANVMKGDAPAGRIEISMRGEQGYIDLVALGPETQGTGFGKRYMSHVEDVLFAMGAESIGLHAALTVGGYFWARAGYNFENRGYLEDFRRSISNEWEHRYNQPVGRDILDSIENSWDVALLTGPDGYHIGKNIMLGSDWHGIKWNPDYGWDDDGYDIGKNYYEG